MKNNLQYFRSYLTKRFPGRTMVDIDIAIEKAMEEMHPSKDRTRLKKIVIRLLSEQRKSG